MILTGTPIAKDLTDEWAQLRWLDDSILGIKYITTFRAQYCIMGGYEGRAVVGHKNMTAFKDKVNPHTYRVTKEEIGYIPKHYSEWVYDLTPDQVRLIKQVKQELLAELQSGEAVAISSATAAFTKAQQIANGFIIDEDGNAIPLMPVAKNPRIQAALEYLESREGKHVVWTRFILDRQLLAEGMRAAGINFAEYAGRDEERYNAKLGFMQDPNVRVFLANPQSAGTGTDGLQTVCTQALYYSNSFNSIDRWQSEDRIDRRGMIGGSVYTDLIGRGSIDRYILRNLKKKKGLSAMSLGDIAEAFDPW
jgi:SNF2 family DNA or RNA helicase